ncbi:glycosyltransferase family 4 protein [Patescibacteria group bacterium]|jgi:glycosyltransferase involved in cell wall biosynthesis|nr:glycosyltransferase family 4 protein [Patescibacteria group bacterium]
MRIAIDARMMGAGNTRGIGRYIYETVEALKALGSDHEFVLLQPPIRWYTLAEQIKMPSVFREAKADLVWIPHWNVPLLYRGPYVITIHDLLLIHQPASAKASTRGPIIAWLKRVGHRVVLWNALRHAKAIFVPAQEVARDVAEHYPFAKEKIVVTGEGIAALPEPAANSGLLPTPYLLYFGSAYPHKRLDLLLKMWKTFSFAHPEYSLVIGGEQDVFMRRWMEEAKRQHLPRVHFPGRLSDEELSTFLAHAAVHIHPSSFEGFALPSLEALSLGCPTVAADIPILRELLPEQGVFFFKNGDADDMIRAIETVLVDRDEAAVAARLGGEGARARHNWNLVARKTLDAMMYASRRV